MKKHRNLILLAIIFPLACATSPTRRLADSLSLEEKIGQMILVYHSPFYFLKKHGFGGVLVLQSMLHDPEKLTREIKTSQSQLRIPLIVAIDQEGGTVNRLSYFKKWNDTPSAKELSQWKDKDITSHASKMADALLHLGINTNLAPVLDPATDSKNRKTYMETKKRSFGVLSQILRPATAFARGFKEKGIHCISKHFPGYDVDTNSDFNVATSLASEGDLEKQIKIFEKMSPSVMGIMMSSILYKNVVREPAVLSPEMVGRARKIVGEKIIMTDDLWGTALRQYIINGKPVKRSFYPDKAFRTLVEKAVLAKNDLLMITYPAKAVTMIQIIKALALKNKAVMDHINAASNRILESKRKMGLL